MTQISAGWVHVEALRSDGTVWTWGNNGSGELGNGTTTSSDVPVEVTGLTGVTQVAAGGFSFSTAVDASGTVWTWGYNGFGQLGNGTTTSSDVPVEVTGLTGVTQVAAGGLFVVAKAAGGSVWAWGNNAGGELGAGSTTQPDTPVQIPSITASSISAGWCDAYAIQGNGTALGWGCNVNGELGNGTTTSVTAPTPMPGVTDAAAVAGGTRFTVVLTSAGAAPAAGENSTGQLGNDSTTDAHSFVNVVGWNPLQRHALTHYLYDGNGLRVATTGITGTQSFDWDTTTGIPQILSNGTDSIIYGPGGMAIEQIDANGAPAYFIQGQLGSTRALTDQAGNVVATFTYDAYGAVVSHTGSVTTPVGFAGGYTDPSGLLYLVHRYYDPATGQFLSLDPLVQQTTQPYQYAGNDPVNGSDPSGLCWQLAPGVYGPCEKPPPGVPYGGSFDTEEILQYPQVLTGMNPQDVVQILGGVPEGWQVAPGQGQSVAPGWKMFEVKDGNITGRQIRWGASRRLDHPNDWYWTVSDGETKTSGIPAGDWPGGPTEYVGDTGGVLNGATEMTNSSRAPNR